MPNNVDNISDIPPTTDPSNRSTEDTAIVFKEDVLYLPIENDVDLRIEAEIAAQTQEYREKGYRLFLSGKSPNEIAKALGVKMAAVVFWAKDGGWAERLRKQNDVAEELVRENVRAIRLANAQNEAKESLDISKDLRKAVKKKLKDAEESNGACITPMGLKNLADAAKASGDLSAHGMGDAAAPAQTNNNGNKTPFVMVFPGGLPPLIKRVEDAQ